MDCINSPLFILLQKHQIVSHDVGNVEINDPVHEVEADEAHGEHDAGVLVDVRRRHAEQLAYVLENVNNTYVIYERSLIAISNEVNENVNF